MTLFEKQDIFSANLASLISWAKERSYLVSVREVQRTVYQQKEYIRSGKSQTNNSKHLECLAADVYFMKDGKLLKNRDDARELGEYWKSLDPANRWGGDYKTFDDYPHFEYGG